MLQKTLAETFNEVGRALDRQGHRIIVRKARALLEGGDVQGALRFLREAGERLALDEVQGLVGELDRWAGSGGDTARLVTEPSWMAGSAGEQRLSRSLAQASSGGLDQLIGTLAGQQQALARGEPLPQVLEPRLVPGQMPPLPRSQPAAAAKVEERRPKAVFEAPSRLEERPLELDEPARPEPPAPPPPRAPSARPAAAPPPPPPAAPVEAAPDEAEGFEDFGAVAAAPPPPAPPAAPAPDAGFQVPELPAPPSMPEPKAPAKAGQRSPVVIVAGVLAALAAAAAAYFLMQ